MDKNGNDIDSNLGITQAENDKKRELQMESVHTLRKCIDADIHLSRKMKGIFSMGKGARELALVLTKLQEAKMWAGKILEELGSELPPQYRDEANLKP